MEEFELDEWIIQCKQGLFPDISEGGSVKCYAITPEYVIVPRSAERVLVAQRLKDISNELEDMRLGNVHTIVDYRNDGETCYELQSRARGARFKQRMLEKDLVEEIRRYEEILNKGEINDNEQIKRLNLYLEKDKRMLANSPEKSRKDELIRRCSMLIQMPEEHIRQYFDTILSLSTFYRLGIDTVGDGNVLYDSETGFNFIDIDFFDKPHRSVPMKHMLDAGNSDTMTELIGTDYLYEIEDNEKIIVIQEIKDALKKIIISLIDFEHCGEKLSVETIQSSLNTYREYGIDLTYEEIVQEMQKETGTQQLGKETVSVQSETAYIDETSQAMEEQRRLIEQQQANDRPSI